MSVFARFPERLQHAIANHLGSGSLRAVQELAGDAILDGKNAVVLAPTAGGKTTAAIFPVLAQLLESQPSSVGAIYGAPIKALLNNQEVRLGDYTQMVGLDRFVWHGDAGQSQKQSFCREPTRSSPLLCPNGTCNSSRRARLCARPSTFGDAWCGRARARLRLSPVFCESLTSFSRAPPPHSTSSSEQE
ncbi:MAG TPA: DEAD/DEAH box helicase [Polyangiaceae bacterium]|nr:DEAD/DEAH box helicase [Polyangiaceae bacterium]